MRLSLLFAIKSSLNRQFNFSLLFFLKKKKKLAEVINDPLLNFCCVCIEYLNSRLRLFSFDLGFHRCIEKITKTKTVSMDLFNICSS